MHICTYVLYVFTVINSVINIDHRLTKSTPDWPDSSGVSSEALTSVQIANDLLQHKLTRHHPCVQRHIGHRMTPGQRRRGCFPARAAALQSSSERTVVLQVAGPW